MSLSDFNVKIPLKEAYGVDSLLLFFYTVFKNRQTKLLIYISTCNVYRITVHWNIFQYNLSTTF